MASMQDIALKAGVSRTAVSFVMSGRQPANGSISEATRARVLMAAQELNYKPNELARAVSRGRSRVIGFLTRNPEAEHVARLVAGALAEADERGYFVKILRPCHDEFDQRLLDQCIELRLAGSIAAYLSAPALKEYHHELERFDIPLALLDDSETQRQSWGHPVLADYAMGMQQAVDHLYDLGHREIGFVGGPREDNVTAPRLAAFIRALENKGLTVRDENFLHAPWGQLMPIIPSDLAQMSARPTAFVGATDAASLSLLRAAWLLGLRVPNDFSVVSFGDLAPAYLSSPQLTAIHHPFFEMGRLAVRQLLGSLEVNTAPPPLAGGRLPTHLVVRESTAPPKF